MNEIMNEDDVRWIWNRLQGVIKSAEEERGIHPGLVTWSYLRFSTSLHFQRFSAPGAATMMALDILMGTIREHQNEEPKEVDCGGSIDGIQDDDLAIGAPTGATLQ